MKKIYIIGSTAMLMSTCSCRSTQSTAQSEQALQRTTMTMTQAQITRLDSIISHLAVHCDTLELWLEHSAGDTDTTTLPVQPRSAATVNRPAARTTLHVKASGLNIRQHTMAHSQTDTLVSHITKVDTTCHTRQQTERVRQSKSHVLWYIVIIAVASGVIIWRVKK